MSTHGAVHKWFPEDKVQDERTSLVGTNWRVPVALWLGGWWWWYFVVLGSCMESSMVISSCDKYRSWCT